jgi:hypothetical protein
VFRIGAHHANVVAAESRREQPLLDGLRRGLGADGVGGRIDLDELFQDVVSESLVRGCGCLEQGGESAHEDEAGVHGISLNE